MNVYICWVSVVRRPEERCTVVVLNGALDPQAHLCLLCIQADT